MTVDDKGTDILWQYIVIEQSRCRDTIVISSHDSVNPLIRMNTMKIKASQMHET